MVFTVVAPLEECRLKIVLFQKIPILYSLLGVFVCDTILGDSKGGISKRASGTFAPTRLDGSGCMQSETTRAGKQHLYANPPGYTTNKYHPTGWYLLYKKTPR